MNDKTPLTGTGNGFKLQTMNGQYSWLRDVDMDMDNGTFDALDFRS